MTSFSSPPARTSVHFEPLTLQYTPRASCVSKTAGNSTGSSTHLDRSSIGPLRKALVTRKRTLVWRAEHPSQSIAYCEVGYLTSTCSRRRGRDIVMTCINIQTSQDHCTKTLPISCHIQSSLRSGVEVQVTPNLSLSRAYRWWQQDEAHHHWRYRSHWWRCTA